MRSLLTGVLVMLAALALLAVPATAARVASASERAPLGRITNNGDGTFTLRQELPATTMNGTDVGWTSVYSAFPDMANWFGAGQGDGRARAGYNGWTPPTSVIRSYFQFDMAAVQGKRVLRAELNLFGAFSSGCGTSALSLRATGPITPGTTWNTQPPVYSSQYRTEPGFCGGGRWLGFDVTGDIVSAAGRAAPTATFGAAAQNENDMYALRAYGTGATGTPPVLTIIFEGATTR
jgi:hypothetical protein